MPSPTSTGANSGTRDRRSYRMSARHRVVLFDRLPQAEQERLAPLRRDPELYGVIIPCEGVPGTTLIAASREVALLLLTLSQPGPLPAYIADAHDPAIDRTITQLVLDGVLEVDSGGEFVSGASALRTVHAENEHPGRIATLSHAALAFGAAFDARDAADLEARLYTYNHVAITPAWSARIPTAAAVRSFLVLDQGPTATVLNRHWFSQPAGASSGWIHWNSEIPHETSVSDRDATYKLYISPTLEALPQVFRTTVSVLAEARVSAFKVGSSARGLARPDKLVAYFRSRERAVECGRMLCATLGNAPAQGVPFSAELGGDGMVSWGVDPPSRYGRPLEQSWRRWVCRRLAQYLLAARSAPDPLVPPSRFALERLRLDGVDTTHWEPDVARMTADAEGDS
jgi:hypothetical protein